VICEGEEECGNGIDIRPIFREGLQNPNGVRVISSKERLDSVNGCGLRRCVSGNYKNASGQQRRQSHRGFDAC
jgi:hypothetical protein